jgi:hypothetical protein
VTIVFLISLARPFFLGNRCYGTGTCLDKESAKVDHGNGGVSGGAAIAAVTAGDLPCHSLPQRPHAPVLKAFASTMFPAGASSNRAVKWASKRLAGEALYNNNEVRQRGGHFFIPISLRTGLLSHSFS